MLLFYIHVSFVGVAVFLCFLFFKYDHDDMMIHLISLLEFEATDGMKIYQVCHRTGANLKMHFH